MKKRNLFAEIAEGFDALAEELVSLRARLKLSRPVFAHYLRTNPRTLENWEQGRAKPNAQAALLIRLVERYPDTVERLPCNNRANHMTILEPEQTRSLKAARLCLGKHRILRSMFKTTRSTRLSGWW